MLRTAAGFLCLVLLLAPRSLEAQSPEPVRLVSFNLFGPAFGIYNVEFEHSLSATRSVALSTTWWDTRVGDDEDDLRYLSADLKARLYAREVLAGFGAAAIAGWTRIENKRYDGPCRPATGVECTETDNAFTLGMAIDYVLRTGHSRNLTFILGFGAKKLFGIGDLSADVSPFYPIARLSIGWAF